MTPPVHPSGTAPTSESRAEAENQALDHFEASTAPRALAATIGPEAAALPAHIWDRALHEPLRDFLSEPGKGFRANLVKLGWRLGGGATRQCPSELAVVLEWLHAGSLIVDDIEDGSLTRRGRPALHVTYGLPRALNAGNFLYFSAQQLLEKAGLAPSVTASLQAMVVDALVKCHHGQALDLSARIEALTQAEVGPVVKATTALKTGALTSLAAAMGACAAGARDERVKVLAQFGHDLGVSLQMLDDLGSVLSESRRNKGVEDLRGGHPTWAWAWLSEAVDPFTFSRLVTALKAVENGADPAPLFAEMQDRLSHLGRAKVSAQLEKTLQGLREGLGAKTDLSAVEAELERLRRSYV